MSAVKTEQIQQIFLSQLDQAYRAGQQSVLAKLGAFADGFASDDMASHPDLSRQMERAMTQFTLLAAEDETVMAMAANPHMVDRPAHHALRPGPRLFEWLNTYRQDFESLEVVHWGGSLVEAILEREGTDQDYTAYSIRTSLQHLQNKVLLELHEAGLAPNMMTSKAATNALRKAVKTMPLSEKIALDYNKFCDLSAQHKVDLGAESDSLYAYGAAKAKWRLDLSKV